jgi:hypothetical protein
MAGNWRKGRRSGNPHFQAARSASVPGPTDVPSSM